MDNLAEAADRLLIFIFILMCCGVKQSNISIAIRDVN